MEENNRRIMVMQVKKVDDKRTLYIQTDNNEFLAVDFDDAARGALDKWKAGEIDDETLVASLEVDIDKLAAHVSDTVNTKLERLSDRLHTDGMHIYIDGDGFDKQEIDSALEDHLVRMLTTRNDSEEDARNWKSFVAFTENLYDNTDSDIRSQIFSWMQAQKWLTLTEDGCIIGYKGCQKNPETGIAESIHCGPGIVDDVIYNGHIPNPDGARVEIAKGLVTKDPADGCASGLHVGTYDYAYSFARDVILKVKVNPRDIVSVPYDCSAQKVRCCRYDVIEHTDVERSWEEDGADGNVFGGYDMSWWEDGGDYDDGYPGCDGECGYCEEAPDCKADGDPRVDEYIRGCETDCNGCTLSGECCREEELDEETAFNTQWEDLREPGERDQENSESVLAEDAARPADESVERVWELLRQGISAEIGAALADGDDVSDGSAKEETVPSPVNAPGVAFRIPIDDGE